MRKIILVLLVAGLLLPGCTNKETIKEDSVSGKDEKLVSNLSPGTVLVEAKILETKENKNKIEIIKVIGYGSSTPKININEKIYVSLNNSLKENNKLSVGEVHQILLKHMMMLGNTGDSNWVILKIEKGMR